MPIPANRRIHVTMGIRPALYAGSAHLVRPGQRSSYMNWFQELSGPSRGGAGWAGLTQDLRIDRAGGKRQCLGDSPIRPIWRRTPVALQAHVENNDQKVSPAVYAALREERGRQILIGCIRSQPMPVAIAIQWCVLQPMTVCGR